jgi:hypothetical protein
MIPYPFCFIGSKLAFGHRIGLLYAVLDIFFKYLQTKISIICLDDFLSLFSMTTNK